MTQTLQHRKPSAHRRQSGSLRRQPAQPAKRRRLSRPFSVFLLAMTYGSTIALLVVTVGFTTLVRNGTAVTDEALQLQRAGAGGGHGGGGHGGSQPNIRIEARHVGNMVLDIKAEVSMNQDRDPLVKAKVVAFTDMVQMPNVHTKGPLPLQAVPGNPGMYETTTNLSMPGDYEVRVEVQDPVQGQKATTVAVSTTSYDINQPERQAQYQKGREP